MVLPSNQDWIARSASLHGARPALVAGRRRVSYADLDGLVAGAAATLAAAIGVGPGVRIGVAAHRRIDTIVLLWAIWRLGATAVVFDPAAPSLDSGEAALCRRWGLAAVLASVEESIPTPAAVGPDETAATGAPDAEPHHTWVPTSGSAGSPRPVILTHGNVAAAVAASQARLGNGLDDCWLLTLPLFHVGGLSILWRSAAAGGAVRLQEHFDAAGVASCLGDGSVTFASLVPTMLQRIVATGVTPSPRLRVVLVGGAGAGRDLVTDSLAAGFPVITTYGLTEACSQVATVAPGSAWDAVGTVGRPLDGVEVSIDAASGDGEIIVAGPTVSPGYAFEEPRRGPLRTGDVGRLDAEGRLVVVGRVDDMFTSGGENVAPAAVEAAMSRSPLVDAIVVYGLPDAEWGARTAATVVTAGGPGVAALDAEARRILRPAERPRSWRIVAALPLLANGKVDRAAAAERHLRSSGE